jgi:hypothetical protein
MQPRSDEPLNMTKKKIAEKIYTLICDDIRHEVGNKISLIGLYDNIVVRETPIILPKINLAILLKGLKQEIRTIKVDLKRPNGEIIDLPEFKMPPNAKIGSNHNLDLCVAPLKIDAPGKFVWEIRIDGEDKPSLKHDMIVSLPPPPETIK